MDEEEHGKKIQGENFEHKRCNFEVAMAKYDTLHGGIICGEPGAFVD